MPAFVHINAVVYKNIYASRWSRSVVSDEKKLSRSFWFYYFNASFFSFFYTSVSICCVQICVASATRKWRDPEWRFSLRELLQAVSLSLSPQTCRKTFCTRVLTHSLKCCISDCKDSWAVVQGTSVNAFCVKYVSSDATPALAHMQCTASVRALLQSRLLTTNRCDPTAPVLLIIKSAAGA